MRPACLALIASLLAGSAGAGCSAGSEGADGNGPSGSSSGGNGQGANGAGGSTGSFGQGGSLTCSGSCSPDLHSVLDCNGTVVASCVGDQGCNPATLACENACAAAAATKQSVGCEYYATDMEQNAGVAGHCFAAYVANTWNTPAKIGVERAGQVLDPSIFARIPQGAGQSLTYQAYDPNVGIPAGEVVILFLSGGGTNVTCPVTPAVSGDAGILGTGIGSSFRITSDVPVVAYQMNPYGGGNAAVTAGSLLLPTSAWDTNYIAVNVTPYDIANPSMNLVAAEDATNVTILPVAAMSGGGGIPGGAANQAVTFTLNRGQQAQISQQAELTGSVIESDKPIGLMAGQPCMRIPTGVAYCDHGEQMVPPIRALGNEYVGVMHKPRQDEPAFWRVIGVVDGTELTWSSPVGGPAMINRGQQALFPSSTPFVVQSQDADHPFLLFTYMTSSTYQQNTTNQGDPDMVISVPPQQYLRSYVFFTDPTYPETSLVLVRAPIEGSFRDVNLDCLGPVTGWQPVGAYEYARVDLMTGFNPVGNCSNGRHDITSDAPFGLWVWGWGTPFTSPSTQNVSYGYPGGMNVIPINDVVIPPQPE